MAEHDSAATLTGILAHWAKTAPHSVAVECRGETLTYRELDGAAQNVADHLHRRGVAPGEVVALSLTRSLGSVVAILGVLKAGCAYVPLDADVPDARNAEVLTRTSPALVIADTRSVVEHHGIPVLLLNECTDRAAHVETPEVSASSLAYIMPTSGTGGALKLVRISHGNVVYNVRALRSAVGDVTPDDIYLHFASFSFSSSIRQLFLPLSAGARVVVAVGSERLDPAETLDLIRRREVTIADLIPSFLAVVVDALESRAPGELNGMSLRLLLLASERLPAALVSRWAKAWPGPHVDVRNMYGQTETAGIVSVHHVDETAKPEGTVPIGRPIGGSDILVVDDALVPVRIGTVGEIVVSGGGLSSEYHGDDALTAQRFANIVAGTVPDGRFYRTGDLGRRTESGVIEFVGREDSQVKVSGHKVDLAQVERVLETHPAVAEAVVANTAAPSDEVRVEAFVRCADGYIDERAARRLRELPNGLRMLDLNPPETDFMYEEIYVREVYLRGGIEVPENACVIDAGANIGLFSLSVATKHPDARVYAFEPAAPAAAVMKTNLVANGCTNVSVRVQGLSNRRGSAVLTFYPHSVGMSSVHANRDEEHATLTSIISNQMRLGELPGGPELREFTTDLVDAKLVERTLECSLTRISDVFDAEGLAVVDLLKVDVQKSELDLLGGIRDEHWIRIKQIVLEVQDLDGRLDKIVADLADRGYSTIVEQDDLFTGSDVYYVYARRDSARPAGPRPVAHRTETPIPVSGAELRRFLGERVSSFQLPHSIEIRPDFPRTVSGKADRNAIARTEPWSDTEDPTPGDQGLDPVVEEILGIFVDVLKKPVAPSDDFFEIGGNSLSAARVITRIRERYSPAVKIGMIFAESRLDLFAAQVVEILAARSES